MIDPHEDVPRIKTSNTTIFPEELPTPEEELRNLDTGNESMWKQLSQKQKKNMFKMKLKEKQTRVSTLQIAEFLGEFLHGTEVLHHQAFLAMCPGALMELSGEM